MLASFVQEIANAPGSTITIALGGAATGRRSFASAFASGAAFYYAMDDGSQGEWGIGTITHGTPATLTRGTVLGNTIGTTTRMTFTGLTRVYVTLPAERALWRDAAGNVELPGAALVVAPAGLGRVGLRAGSAANPGYVEFFTPEGTRRGYIGWQDPGNSLAIVAEAGWQWRVSGALAVGGDVTVAKAEPRVVLAKAATNQANGILGRNGALQRWDLILGDAVAETGGNAGSRLALNRFSDAGAYIDTPLLMSRATGRLELAHAPVNPQDAATKAYVDALTTQNRQVFTASGTWTKPAGYPADTLVLIQVWGAGGSAASAWRGDVLQTGGGGGAHHDILLPLSLLGSTETVIVGAGGASVTPGSGGARAEGIAGGTSSFGAILRATGGQGGSTWGETALGGARQIGPAHVAVTDLQGAYFNGGPSGTNSIYGGGGGGNANSSGFAAGTSVFGGAGGTGGGTVGAPGMVPGGGGGAPVRNGPHPSGAGARGEVRVTVIV